MKHDHSISRQQLRQQLDQILQPQNFSDYGPNGLQVEGKESIKTIVSGVTASLALIQAAVDLRADAILVHHGLFWRQVQPVVGWMKQRLALLLQHEINLYAYHLPLDAHPQLGNNAQLGQLLGWQVQQQFGEQGLLFMAEIEPTSLNAVAQQLRQKLAREVILLEGDSRPIRRVVWCSGGGQGFFEQAIAAGADLFITGEISEPQAHYAREMGVGFIAAGHHATERYGVQALGNHLQQQLQLKHQFIDIDNPA